LKMKRKKSYTFFQGLWRKIKKNYYQLIRSKGATSIIARSFAIGIAVEFITLPTAGLAFLLLFPLIKLFRGVFSVALIGFVMGKIILPLFFVINYKVGELVIEKLGITFATQETQQSFFLNLIGGKGLAYLAGSFVTGCIVAVISYGLVYTALVMYRKSKENRMRERQKKTLPLKIDIEEI
jgi:uncharacterized protein (DUF2062 family)